MIFVWNLGLGHCHRADGEYGNKADQDTFRSLDSSHQRRSVQCAFEHTVAMTKDGSWVLTHPPQPDEEFDDSMSPKMLERVQRPTA